ncbi:FmdB family zinc ribbon protein [Microcella sp.]|uniref:FmdB family zinc ribbon protein n=1 Tax=Microcella sp. TaxID=1913979 RepID=UPI0025616460|nr:FmdB family zinc ribbon protein [Microcella sp.]MBX9471606.1 FmdB family transcriptional regulator [Microcella sp.]
MPTYSYRCTDCSTAFDISQAFTDDSLTVCPSCDGRLRKVFSAVGVTFNGSGFYRTDSRAGAGGSKKSEGGTGSSESKGSDSSSAPATKKAETSSSTSTPAKATAAS